MANQGERQRKGSGKRPGRKKNRRLAGGYGGVDVGRRLRVELVRTDVERYIDFTKVNY